MDKQEFLTQLHKGLAGFPQEDVEERLAFYREMIDDRIEEGLSESEAVSAVGSVDEIVAGILADMPLTKIVKKKLESKRTLKAWEIVLLILGSPVWLSLLIAAFAVALSLYASLWCVVVSLWATFGSLVGCAFGGVVAGIRFAFGNNGLTGVAIIGAGIVCAGLSVFLFCGCKAATKGTLLLTKKILVGIKKCFRKKEEA